MMTPPVADALPPVAGPGMLTGVADFLIRRDALPEWPTP